MKNNKILLAFILVSGLFFTNNSFAIEDIKTETSQEKPVENTAPEEQKKEETVEEQKLENTVFEYEDVSETKFTNDILSNFSLDDCIKIGIKNNLSIQSSALNDAMYKEKIGQAWSEYFPKIGAGINVSRGRSYEMDNYTSSFLPQVSADMTIFDFGKTKAKADSAKRTYQSKEFETKEHINYIVCNIKKAYHNLLFAQAQYLVYTDTVKDFELQKQQALSLYKAGKKAKVDVAIADYNLCKAQLNFEKAKNTLKVAKYELSRLMGFPEYSNYTLTGQLIKDNYSVDIEKAMDFAYEVRPELLAVQKSSEAAKMTLRAKRRDFTPNVSLNASYGNNIGTEHYNSYAFGANLSYTNFNIMKTKKEINEARYAYEKSKVDVEDTKHSLYLSISTAYENLITTYNSIGIAENALEQAKEQYRQTTGRYKAGIADIIELKDGENAFLNARLDYYNSLLNYNNALAEFEKEIGAPLKNYTEKISQNQI